MTNKVTITVSGHSGVGKSAIADLLYELMSATGFITSQVDSDSTDFRNSMSPDQKIKQLEYLKNNVFVVVDEKQTRREKIKDEQHA